MNKFLDGIKIGFGIIFSFLILFSLSFALGFHSADEIIGGTFSGDYIFKGKIEVNDLRLNNSNLVCDLTREGSIRYNGSNFEGCNGTSWNELGSSEIISSRTIDVVDIFGDGSGTHLYTFDNTLNDLGINGDDIISDATDSWESGKFGTALLTGGNQADRVSIPFGTDSTTLSVWSKFAGGSTRPKFLLFQITNYNLGIGWGENGDTWYLWSPGSEGYYAGEDNSNWWDGTWHHYVFSFDAGTLKVYVDNNLIKTTTYTPDSLTTLDTIGFGDSSNQMSYEQMRVFNRPVTVAEVDKLYNEIE